MTHSLFPAIACVVLGIVTGQKDARGIFMPHTGYTWAAVVMILIYLGLQ